MFNIVIMETKAFLRDKTNLFFLILFPAMLVFVLGSLMSSADKAEEAIGDIKIQYLLETKNSYEKESVINFFEAVGENSSITFEKSNDLAKARELAAEDVIAAAVVFSGDPMKIQVYEGTNQIKNRTVKAILESFRQTSKAVSAVISQAPEKASNINESALATDYIQAKNLGVNRTMMDYYAVSMVTMIGFMSALGGASAFVGERQNKTINRMILAPQNRISLFLQKILGMVPQAVVQITVIMLVSVLVFKAHYASNIIDNLFLFLFFLIMTLCMNSIGAVVGLMVKTSPMVVLMPVIWLMLFFGGTFAKTVNIKGLTEVMPNYLIQQAAFDLAIFGNYRKAVVVMISCSIIMVMALIFGSFLFSRKEEER